MADNIAKKLLAEVTETLKTIQQDAPRRPTLVAFLANNDDAAKQYAEWSKKTCEEKYVPWTERPTPWDATG